MDDAPLSILLHIAPHALPITLSLEASLSPSPSMPAFFLHRFFLVRPLDMFFVVCLPPPPPLFAMPDRRDCLEAVTPQYNSKYSISQIVILSELRESVCV